MTAVDTNVFIYALDDNEPVKQAKARDLLDQLVRRSPATQLLWQVTAEVLSCLRKWESAGRLTRVDAEAHFQDVLAMFPLSLPTANLFPISFQSLLPCGRGSVCRTGTACCWRRAKKLA